MSDGIKHILVPTDGSESALKAAKLAGELARSLGAKVTIAMVHLEDAVPGLAWSTSFEVDEVRAKIEQDAAAGELDATRAALGDGAPEPAVIQIWGHPAEQICEHAEQSGVDLIVMGSHGRSGFKRAFVGSVSHAVANHACCPVTIVR